MLTGILACLPLEQLVKQSATFQSALLSRTHNSLYGILLFYPPALQHAVFCRRRDVQGESMTQWTTTLVTYLVVLFSVSTAVPTRSKRDLLDLADMFEVATGLDATDYIPYGNWCGYGGGGTAVDLIDRCCELHDKCYDAAALKECPNVKVHTVRYFWTSQNGTVTCDSEQSECENAVCKCDKDVVECIVQYSHLYSEDKRYIRYQQ